MLTRQSLKRLLAPASLAISVSLLASSGLVLANPGDVNSTNNGQNVAGGTYYNTPGDKTTFTNTAGTGLYIGPSTTVIGREVSNSADPTGSLTGNGGWLHFSAPGQVVRIDGKIDADALSSGGAYIGNGGHISVDAAYLYQNGQVYASGINGGHIQFNVGAMTLGPAGSITAQGHGGSGGIIELGNASSHGVFDFQPGSIVDASGKIVGNYDTTLIRIEGGLINLEGILVANGVNATTPSGNGSDGGTITLLAKGDSTAVDSALLSSASFMSDHQANLVARDASLRVNNYDGWIRLGNDGAIVTNGGNGQTGADGEGGTDDGGNGGDGGYISLTAKCGIENNGTIANNGGQGGDAPTTYGELSTLPNPDAPTTDGQPSTVHNPDAPTTYSTTSVTTTPSSHVEENAVGKDGGNGGDGGNIDFQYGTVFHNNGSIFSIGGNGGNGGDAIATNTAAQHSWAFGADGGNGSDGGNIDFTGGSAPVTGPVGLLSQEGGLGGLAGHGFSQTLGNASNGDDGNHGDIGVYDFTHVGFCATGCSDGGGPIVPPDVPTPPGGPINLLSDLNGLFQQNRPVFNEPVNNQVPPLMLALGQSKMFLAKTYSSVTQEILSLALREYTRLLASGRPAGASEQEAKGLLERSGVDATIAQALLDRISDGKLQAGDVVVQMLKEIAEGNKTSVLPPQP